MSRAGRGPDLSPQRASGAVEPPSNEWTDPPALISENGVLEAGSRTVALGGVKLDAMLYCGLYPGPVLRVRPGDLIRITLVNHLNEPTNPHCHGIQTSPLGDSGNVHVLVPPGGSFRYQVRIPADQPPGLCWYHAHAHGLATQQVTNGLSGAFVVEGIEAKIAAPRGQRSRGVKSRCHRRRGLRPAARVRSRIRPDPSRTR